MQLHTAAIPFLLSSTATTRPRTTASVIILNCNFQCLFTIIALKNVGVSWNVLCRLACAAYDTSHQHTLWVCVDASGNYLGRYRRGVATNVRAAVTVGSTAGLLCARTAVGVVTLFRIWLVHVHHQGLNQLIFHHAMVAINSLGMQSALQLRYAQSCKRIAQLLAPWVQASELITTPFATWRLFLLSLSFSFGLE